MSPSRVAKYGPLVAALLVAAALVLLRSYIFLRYAPTFFDSDQAVVGLMAKHLSEGRGFPLFFYGQSYMLGVESWIAVPFFWIGGPTVAMLRLPLVLINMVVGMLTVTLLWRRGLGSLSALIASLPVIVTSPIVSAELVTALGACIEPFLYVYLLWALRRRPIWWGSLFAVAVLHREFVLFALPALVLASWMEGRRWTWREWLGAGGAMLAVWLVVDLLKWHVGTYGPGASAGETSSLSDEARVISAWLSFDLGGYLARTANLFRWLPEVFGGTPYALRDWSLDDTLAAGSHHAGVALAAALAIGVVRFLSATVGSPDRGRDRRVRLAFPAYLAVVAAATMLAYGLNGAVPSEGAPITRYVLFALLAPVALLTAWLMVEANRVWRAVGLGLVAVWSVFTLSDTVRWTDKLHRDPPGSEFRALADDLVAHGVRYGRAQYWDAYVVTFFARERVVLASTGKVRIAAYQSAVEAHPEETATVTRVPCEGGRHVASWCIAGPESGAR